MSMFYVYIDWTLESTPRAFYVGKSNQRRIKYIPRNKHHGHIVNKHSHRREIAFASDDQEACLIREIELIAELRTFVYDSCYNGIGCNYTQGGEGSSGAKRSAKTKQKLSERRLALLKTGWRPVLSDDVKAHLSVKAIEREAKKREREWHPTEETRKKMSEASKAIWAERRAKGWKFNEKARQQMSMGQQRRRKRESAAL